ncbi:transmembrane protein 177 [Harpegnathos saltator]|uniref:Transmembrane protein 177 n=1 Tax=Harpegnathos saltator TaxID=610380 RepID=E2C9F1_HARSA|nr:transmembrane protein 177 [Harpegnathos saltator]EFN75429.1 Transmembrane protein 177 [Harpegnathos saltator]
MRIPSFKFRNSILGVTATAVGYYAILTPHTVFLNRYKSIMARYQSYIEVPLSPYIHRTIQQVMDDLKLPQNIQKVIKPFSVHGLDVFQMGTLNAKYGARLGIPVNFCSTTEELHDKLQIKDEPINWSQEEAKALLNSLILSEGAKKFAIAREVLRIQAEEPCFNSFGLAVIIAVLWILYNTITLRFQLRDRNVTLCRSLYLSFTLLGAIIWIGIKDYHSYSLDSEHDRTLCALGAEYVKGGQEFYEKMLMRNKALWYLLEEDGKKGFTSNGNERTFLRQKHIPITYRRDFFNSQLN